MNNELMHKIGDNNKDHEPRAGGKPTASSKQNRKGGRELSKMVVKNGNKQVGNLGEEVACTFLMKQGYTIIGRNYLRKYGEIDIICSKEGVYYFVEVKTVTRKTDYRPEENVHPLKLKRMARAVEAYIHEKKLMDREWKCLVVSVLLNMDTRMARVTILEDVVI